MAGPSASPVRFTSGFTSDPVYGPLSAMGMQNPFFYHLWSDDFDQEIAESGYTKTTTGNGTVGLTAGDGGQAAFVTNSTTPLVTDIAAIQLPAAGFTLTAIKKSFFLCRITMADWVNPAFLAGLIQTTATPFTVTDGIYFSKASGSAANLTINTAIGGVITTQVIPINAYTLLVNGGTYDFGFAITRLQSLRVFVGQNLVGFTPQSGTGSGTIPRGAVSELTVLGSVQATGNYWTPTTAALNPTLAIQSGTASSKTMNADFLMTSKER